MVAHPIAFGEYDFAILDDANSRARDVLGFELSLCKGVKILSKAERGENEEREEGPKHSSILGEVSECASDLGQGTRLVGIETFFFCKFCGEHLCWDDVGNRREHFFRQMAGVA